MCVLCVCFILLIHRGQATFVCFECESTLCCCSLWTQKSQNFSSARSSHRLFSFSPTFGPGDEFVENTPQAHHAVPSADQRHGRALQRHSGQQPAQDPGRAGRPACPRESSNSGIQLRNRRRLACLRSRLCTGALPPRTPRLPTDRGATQSAFARRAKTHWKELHKELLQTTVQAKEQQRQPYGRTHPHRATLNVGDRALVRCRGRRRTS